MNPLDILIVLIFAYCMLLGFFRGFIREITAIAGVIGGFFCALFWYKEGAKFLSQWLSDPSYMNILAFFVIFFLVYTLAWVAGIFLRRVVKAAFGKWFDRLSGVFFGALKSILIVSILLAVLVAFLKKDAAVLRKSVLAPHVTLLSEKIVSIVPGEMKKEYTEKSEILRKAWTNIRK